MWLRGLGCFLYDTPEMIHIRNITKQRVEYPLEAKKNLSKFSVVLETPEYKRVTELKTHLSNVSVHTLAHSLSFHILAHLNVSISIFFTAHLQSAEQAGHG